MTTESGRSRRPSAQLVILDYLLANVGKVLDARLIQRAIGGESDWSREVRALINEYGYQIATHTDRSDLMPDQYLMLSAERRPAYKRGVSKATQDRVLSRDKNTCQMCGHMPGDPDPLGEKQTVRITIRYIVEKSSGGSDAADNLRAVCTNCNEGLQNTALPKPDRIHLLAQMRRATRDDQQAVLDWLLQKFGLKVERE